MNSFTVVSLKFICDEPYWYPRNSYGWRRTICLASSCTLPYIWLQIQMCVLSFLLLFPFLSFTSLCHDFLGRPGSQRLFGLRHGIFSVLLNLSFESNILSKFVRVQLFILYWLYPAKKKVSSIYTLRTCLEREMGKTESTLSEHVRSVINWKSHIWVFSFS
jgi:hypothetical protein